MVNFFFKIQDNSNVNILITYQWIKYKGKIFYLKNTPLILNQKGQSLIEFLLLFMVMMGVTIIFYQSANSNINALWESLLNLIIDDKNQRVKIGA